MIIYFSGTGNSKRIAQVLATELDDELVDAGSYIQAGKTLDRTSAKPWIIVSPTYCWRLPRILEDLLRAGKLQGAKQAYFVMTCGSDIGNAAHGLKQLCKAKGWDFMGVMPIVMPENYIALFAVPDQETSDRLVRLGEKFACRAARTIAAGQKFKEVPVTLLGHVTSGPVNPLFYRFAVRDKAFYATDACISCGQCVRDCVMNNIRLENGKPQWQGKCTHCMACISSCPRQAIEYGKKSQGQRRHWME